MEMLGFLSQKQLTSISIRADNIFFKDPNCEGRALSSCYVTQVGEGLENELYM